MKLIIQIPCYNEAETLEIALNALPKKIEGIDEIEYRIRIDNDIRTVTKASVQACHKSFCKSFILFEVHDVVHAPFFCHRHDGHRMTARRSRDKFFNCKSGAGRFWRRPKARGVRERYG